MNQYPRFYHSLGSQIKIKYWMSVIFISFLSFKAQLNAQPKEDPIDQTAPNKELIRVHLLNSLASGNTLSPRDPERHLKEETPTGETICFISSLLEQRLKSNIAQILNLTGPDTIIEILIMALKKFNLMNSIDRMILQDIIKSFKKKIEPRRSFSHTLADKSDLALINTLIIVVESLITSEGFFWNTESPILPLMLDLIENTKINIGIKGHIRREAIPELLRLAFSQNSQTYITTLIQQFPNASQEKREAISGALNVTYNLEVLQHNDTLIVIWKEFNAPENEKKIPGGVLQFVLENLCTSKQDIAELHHIQDCFIFPLLKLETSERPKRFMEYLHKIRSNEDKLEFVVKYMEHLKESEHGAWSFILLLCQSEEDYNKIITEEDGNFIEELFMTGLNSQKFWEYACKKWGRWNLHQQNLTCFYLNKLPGGIIEYMLNRYKDETNFDPLRLNFPIPLFVEGIFRHQLQSDATKLLNWVKRDWEKLNKYQQSLLLCLAKSNTQRFVFGIVNSTTDKRKQIKKMLKGYIQNAHDNTRYRSAFSAAPAPLLTSSQIPFSAESVSEEPFRRTSQSSFVWGSAASSHRDFRDNQSWK